MAQKTRIVTVIDDVQVIEVATHDVDGDPLETYYYVQGEKYLSLKQARDAARRISDEHAETKY